MIGWIQYEEAKKARVECRRYGDAAVLTVRVPHCEGVRGALSAYRAASLLMRQRVRLAAFPIDYPYTDMFLRRGIAPSDATQLNLACATQITLFVLRQRGIAPGNANVALVSEKTCRELHETAHSLARTVRYLTLCTPDADALALALRREYGIAAKVLGENDAVHANLALSFNAIKGGGLALSDVRLEASYSAELDGKTYTDAPLLAAFLSVGALRGQDIRLERLILPETANFS